MIWRLGIGQLRANRGYFLRTVSLIALLVAVLTHVIVIGATQATLSKRTAALWGENFTRHGSVVVTEDGTWSHDEAVTPAELRELIDGAPGSVALAQGGARTVPMDEMTWTRADEGFAVLATYGARDVDALLQAGSLPDAPGQIAVASDLADALGWTVGDTATLYADVWVPSSDDETSGTMGDAIYTYEIVGLLSPTTMPGFWLSTPGAVVAWADVESPDGLMSMPSRIDDGVRGTAVTISWDGASPALDRYFEWDGGIGYDDVILPAASGVWFALAAVLAAAMIIMSFAVGRTQAATRSGWIATARTLGATKRVVAWATVAETVVMASIALVVGVVAGIVAAQAQLSFAAARSGIPFAPSTVSLHWAIVPTVAFATLLVTVAIAAIPAFWAARVPPVAALKPVTDITEAELSRRVSPHWLWIPAVLGPLMILAGNWQPTAPLDTVIVFGMIIAVIGIAGLAIEGTRWAIPTVGRRLARSASPSRLTAGDALATRPRLAVAPALIALAAVGVFTLWVLHQAATMASDAYVDGWYAYGEASFVGGAGSWGSMGLLAAIVLGSVVVQLVTTAIFAAHRASTGREVATRRALGLSSAHEERAQRWQLVVPQALGAGIGLVVGVIVFAVWRAMDYAIDGRETPWAAAFAKGEVLALTAALVLLATAVIAAWLTARIGRTATPLASLRPGS